MKGRSTFRVGELAHATGVTVRTLHHYEEAGLLAACGRTEGGHRVFDIRGVERLYQIRALRDLGLSLAQIRKVLHGGAPMSDLLASHLATVEREIGRLNRLRDCLRNLASRADTAADVGELVATLDAMSRLERHMKARKGRPAESGGIDVWRAVGEELRLCMEDKCAPDDARTIAVAIRARDLILRFAGGDSRVLDALARLRTATPPDDFGGWDIALMRYLDAALARLPEA